MNRSHQLGSPGLQACWLRNPETLRASLTAFGLPGWGEAPVVMQLAGHRMPFSGSAGVKKWAASVEALEISWTGCNNLPFEIRLGTV